MYLVGVSTAVDVGLSNLRTGTCSDQSSGAVAFLSLKRRKTRIHKKRLNIYGQNHLNHRTWQVRHARTRSIAAQISFGLVCGICPWHRL